MSDNRHPWPARADIVRLLDGYTCRVIQVGVGHALLTVPAGLLSVVSPQAVAMAGGQAEAAGQVTAERAAAFLCAVDA